MQPNLPSRLAAVLVALVALLCLGVLPCFAAGAAPVPPKPFSRDDARAIVRDAQRIMSPYGIEESRAVSIGGVDQWITVRGRDRRNPILLFIHGGPASTETPVSWLYQSAWEDFFTVVQWDQRAAGKTAAHTADNDAVLKTITIERMTQDGEEMAAYLRQHYGKRKIFVLAHSWGTVIGLNLARRHPDWLHAYIGMGQLISWKENERVGYAFALREARADGNGEAVRQLEAIAPYPPADGVLSFEQVVTQRNWVIHYGGLTAGRENFDYDQNARKISPDYTDRDLSPGVKDGAVLIKLLPELATLDFRGVTRIDCPVFLISGRRDYQTPSEVSATWFARLKAPRKGLFWFEHSAHMMHLEQPGKVLMHLVNDVRPISEKAGDVAPADRAGVGE